MQLSDFNPFHPKIGICLPSAFHHIVKKTCIYWHVIVRKELKVHLMFTYSLQKIQDCIGNIMCEKLHRSESKDSCLPALISWWMLWESSGNVLLFNDDVSVWASSWKRISRVFWERNVIVSVVYWARDYKKRSRQNGGGENSERRNDICVHGF